MSPGLYCVVGTLEVAGASALLLGLAAAPLGVAAAIGSALLMTAAAVVHLRTGDPPVRSLPTNTSAKPRVLDPVECEPAKTRAPSRWVTAVTRSADLLREGGGSCSTSSGRAEVRDAAAAWTGRVDTVTARTDRVDVHALLIRPDGCVARALPTGRDLDATTLVRAPATWFGQPA